MKKILSLLLTAFVALSASAASTWKAGSSDVDAETTLISTSYLKVETVFAAKKTTNAVTYDGVKYSNGLQVRVADLPSSSNPTGTENSGSTPLVFTVSENVNITLVYRRQTANSSVVSNDGKDLKLFDQYSDFTTPINGDISIIVDNASYPYVAKIYESLPAGVYTLAASGTTISLNAIIYEKAEAGTGEETVDAPVITHARGTVAISCPTEGATLTYSLNNGGSWTTYKGAFTLTENATVMARAKVGTATETATAVVDDVIPTPEGTTQYVMYWNNYDTGNSITNADGYTIAITGNKDKTWQGASKLTVNGQQYQTIKLSNGAQNTLTLPEGKIAKRVTFYSYVNKKSDDMANAFWNEVGGVTYGDEGLPMACPSDALTNPDVRVYALDDVTEFTFNNGGNQVCYVMVLDVCDAPQSFDLTIGEHGVATFCSDKNMIIPSTVQAWALAAEDIADDLLVFKKIDGSILPANTGVLLTGEADTHTFQPTTDTAAAVSTLLVGTTAPTELEEGEAYILTHKAEGGLSFRLNNAGTLAANKAYLPAHHINNSTSGQQKPQLRVALADGNTTRILDIDVDAINADNAAYNVLGQKVNNNYRGIVIKNGVKSLNK